MFSEPLAQILTILFREDFLGTLSFWWWLFLIIDCFWIFGVAKYFWYFWRKNVYDNTCQMVILEVRIPAEVLEPLKAMETVITGFWQISSDPNWYEKWREGQSGFSFTLEIASIDGIPHFYIRTEKRFIPMIEAQTYSQYPQAEVFPVEDYTKNVPQDMPNENWDLWGTTYKNFANWAYPIRTYEEFETGREDEEKRIDPIASLLEAMARLKPGEQQWVQLRCYPLLEEAIGWRKEAEKFRDKLARRENSEFKNRSLLRDFFDVLILGKAPPAPPEKKEESFVPVEMKLTPVEKEILGAVERKIGKAWFLCNLKIIYLAKRELFFTPNVRAMMSYFNNYVTNNMNALVPDGNTITKIKKNWYDFFWFVKQRLFLRKRRIFRAYVNRAWVALPKRGFGEMSEQNERFVLSAEEIATLYHFPGRIVASAPTLQRVEAKKGEPPPELPVA